ncbi:hypothetical protein RY831_15255 [Noviherbaspirillum sp. CPCC 100848]|uniref:Uncharacterized protein n=1 Tax=Noviherbaspirillum album TaxID=3080276 RepID=A0ABU6JA38_9BURK|nr:hypothetical protein [Noviherbaspirillum sp. CPCC 100848]MEC4720519.1 hypothetical protein [Noviherbaspirillum sp. CPCC 100848]
MRNRQFALDGLDGLFEFTNAQVNPDRHSTSVQDTDHPLYRRRTIAMVGDDVVANALASDATSRRIMAKGLMPVEGQIVGARLNLNIMKSKGVAVQTIHSGNSSDGYRRGKGLYNGSALAYLKYVCLTDAFFNVGQAARERIASAVEPKHPMGSVDGAYSLAEPNFDGVEVRFDPRRLHLFCSEDNRPIQYAEFVTLYANRVYARGRLIFFDEATAPAKVGTSPSEVRF